jgi:hypothetical protein
MRRRVVSNEARAAYRAHCQRFAARFDHWGLKNTFGSIVRRLDAGEPVVVQGWKLGRGYGSDYSHYCLESDGRVVPVEPIHVDVNAKVLTVADWMRPDGSLVT